MKNMSYPLLKVFSPEAWHEEVKILGNRKSIEDLIFILQRSLENGSSEGEFLESDGEGYSIMVQILDKEFDDNIWNNFPVHYTGDLAMEKNDDKWNNLNNLFYTNDSISNNL